MKAKLIGCLIIIMSSMLYLMACENQVSPGLEESLELFAGLEEVPEAQNSTLIINQGSDLNNDAYFKVKANNILPHSRIKNVETEAWCLEWKKPLRSNGDVHEEVKWFATANNDKWKPLNYFFSIKDNLKSEFDDLTYKEIQAVVWVLAGHMGIAPEFDIEKLQVNQIPSRLRSDGQVDFNRDYVKEISGRVLSNYSTFDVKTGGYALHTLNDEQDLFIYPSAIQLLPDPLTLAVGETMTMSATVFDENGDEISDPDLNWSILDESVASVDQNGMVSGISEGQTTVTAEIEGVTAGATVNVTDTADPEIAAIQLLPDPLTLEVGETMAMSATVLDENGDEISDPDLVWSILDESVASVDQNGMVSGVSEGQTTVTAEIEGVTAGATVNVTDTADPEIAVIELLPDPLTLDVGETMTMDATVLDENGDEVSDPDLVWSILDESVASVDQNGVVTGVSEGQTTVNAEIEGVTANATVNVTETFHTEIVDVTSATGRVWMDRNLGASRVAISATDSEAFGDLYQWGRAADGHEKRDSPTTTMLSNSDTPGHGDFIRATSTPYDWRTPKNDDLWQGENGINNPCPSGYRLPTFEEWDDEVQTWVSEDRAGAFASPLKLPTADYRDGQGGSVVLNFSISRYWSSSAGDITSRFLNLMTSSARTPSASRSNGMPVRCIKD